MSEGRRAFAPASLLSRYDSFMLPEQQNRLVVVLVRARNPSNIGAVARGMHDFGFSHLRVVNEYPVPFEAAQAAEKAAVHASSVLDAAAQPASVAEAVADCTLILGTTAVGDRKLDHPLLSLDDAAWLINQTLSRDPLAKVALLFGSEKTGLSNDELSHCKILVTIPMNTSRAQDDPVRHLSMNLGQAAAVCLYAISHDKTFVMRGVEQFPATATAGELERLMKLLTEVLERSGYMRRHPANAREGVLRRLVWRNYSSSEDATIWTGILRQLLHVLPSRLSDEGPL